MVGEGTGLERDAKTFLPDPTLEYRLVLRLLWEDSLGFLLAFGGVLSVRPLFPPSCRLERCVYAKKGSAAAFPGSGRDVRVIGRLPGDGHDGVDDGKYLPFLSF